MKIRYFKPVSIYTHPSITEYEFERMKKVEKIYLICCLVGFLTTMFCFPCVLLTNAKEPRHILVEKKVLPIKPQVKPSDEGALEEFTYDLPKSQLTVDVGSTTIDTR